MNIGLYVTLPLCVDQDSPNYVIDAQGKTVFCRDKGRISAWAQMLLDEEELLLLQKEIDKLLNKFVDNL